MNGAYEFNTQARTKPVSSSTREEKESWIRAKYEQLVFLKPLGSSVGITQQLVDAVLAREIAVSQVY